MSENCLQNIIHSLMTDTAVFPMMCGTHCIVNIRYLQDMDMQL